MNTPTNISLPSVGQMKAAIGIYLSLAYPDGQVPEVVRQRQVPFLAASDADRVQPPWFEASQSDHQMLYRLRLGQKSYPHMKISLMPAPNATGYLFFADAHDSHLHAPIDSPDYAFLATLRKSNAELAATIEKAWTDAGIPTFRSYLRDSLNQRRKQENS